MAAVFGASGDAPVLLQQAPDPNKAMLAQLLASQADMPVPRTAQAATMQGLARAIAGGTNAWMAGADRREREAGAKEIAGLYGAPTTETPGALERLARAIGIGGDSTPAPAAVAA